MADFGYYARFTSFIEGNNMENVFEHLPKDRLASFLRERINELKSEASRLESTLKNAPRGQLGISPHAGTYQYFHVLPSTTKKGVYISNQNIGLAQSLAQRDYDAKLLSKIRMQLKVLQTCEERYCPTFAEDMWNALHIARKKLVSPSLASDEDFANRWNAVEYKRRDLGEKPVFVTAHGDLVRSKSEVIIADTLHRFKVPYRYEFPYAMSVAEDENLSRKVRKRRVVYLSPDFTCLNVRTRKEFIWEHFGLIDDVEYALNMAGKLMLYQANGYGVGCNLLMTTETREAPLSSKKVEQMVNKFLL